MVYFGLVPPGPAPGPLTPMQRRLREERLVQDCQACFSSNLLGRRRIARGIPVAEKNAIPHWPWELQPFFLCRGPNELFSALTRRFVKCPIAGPEESRNQVFYVVPPPLARPVDRKDNAWCASFRSPWAGGPGSLLSFLFDSVHR